MLLYYIAMLCYELVTHTNKYQNQLVIIYKHGTSNAWLL